MTINRSGVSQTPSPAQSTTGSAKRKSPTPKRAEATVPTSALPQNKRRIVALSQQIGCSEANMCMSQTDQIKGKSSSPPMSKLKTSQGITIGMKVWFAEGSIVRFKQIIFTAAILNNIHCRYSKCSSKSRPLAFNSRQGRIKVVWAPWLKLKKRPYSGLRRKCSWGGSFSAIWRSFVCGVRCLWRHNLTSYSCFQTNVLAKFVDIICMFFYTHSPYFMCHCTEYKLSALRVRISGENKLNQCYDTGVHNCKILAACCKKGVKHTHHCVRAICNCKMWLR